jgi:peptidyl-prolyl cis-trans isomerase D
MQVILLLLIVPSFVFVGAQGYETFVNHEPELATVDGSGITQNQFEYARRYAIEQERQQQGQRFDIARVDNPVTRRQLLDDLIDRRVIETVARHHRFSVSDQALRQYVAAHPAFQDNGQFSSERYRQVLSIQGFSPSAFEASVRQDLALQRVLAPLAETTQLPDVVSARLDRALTQRRTVQVRRFAADTFAAALRVTDTDLKTWYDDHPTALQIPQNVDIEYLLLDEAAATAGVALTDAQVVQYYQQNKERFSIPERRRASHIMIEVPSDATEPVRHAAQVQAAALAEQARANPASFADLARQHSQDAGSASQGGDLGWANAGTLPPALFAALRQLKVGQISDVVASPSGLHVLTLTALEPGKQETLDQVRDRITVEMRRQLAAERFGDLSTKLRSASGDQSTSLEAAASATGLRVRRAHGITRTGLLPAAEVADRAAIDSADATVLNSSRVRDALFSTEVLNQKFNSGLIELAADQLLIVRVVAVHAARVPPLADVTDRIRRSLVNTRSAQAAQAAGLALLTELKRAPVNKPVPKGFDSARAVSRQNFADLSAPVLREVLRMPATPLPSYIGVADGRDYVVVRLSAVDAGAPNSTLQAQWAEQTRTMWGDAESRAVLSVLREQYQARVLPQAESVIRGEAQPG